MKLHPCPVCDQVYQTADDLACRRTLALHIVEKHLDTNGGLSLVCWCGQHLALLSPRFVKDYIVAQHWLAHVDRHGGITAHYHAHLLGID